MIIVSQLLKKYDRKNNEVFAWNPNKNYSKFLLTILKNQILNFISQDENIRPALIPLHQSLPAVIT